MPRRLIAPFTAILTAAAGLPTAAAEELPAFNDLRLVGGVEGTDWEGDGEFSLSGFTTEVEDEERFDEAGFLMLQWVGSQGFGPSGGLLYGAALHGAAKSMDEPFEADYGTYSVRGMLGYGYAFTEVVHLELLPFLGIGGATIDTDRFDPDGEEYEGVYVEGGLNANLVFTFRSGFQLGGAIGFTSSSARFEDEDDTIFGTLESEYDITQAVATGSLFIGVRL